MYGGPISGRYCINGGMPAPQSRAIDGPMVARYYCGYINQPYNLPPSSVYTNIPWFPTCQKESKPTNIKKGKRQKFLYRASHIYCKTIHIM